MPLLLGGVAIGAIGIGITALVLKGSVIGAHLTTYGGIALTAYGAFDLFNVILFSAMKRPKDSS